MNDPEFDRLVQPMGPGKPGGRPGAVSPACGNPLHPRGRWHTKTPLAPSWDFMERASQWFNEKRWGCTCHAMPAVPRSELWKVAACFVLALSVWAAIIWATMASVMKMNELDYWRGTAMAREFHRGGN